MGSVPPFHLGHALQSRFPHGFWVLNSKFLMSALEPEGSHIWGFICFAVCQYFSSAGSSRVNMQGWTFHFCHLHSSSRCFVVYCMLACAERCPGIFSFHLQDDS